MKRRPRLLFWIIVALSFLAICINIPSTINQTITSRIPGIQKPVSFRINTSFIARGFTIGGVRIANKLDFRKGLDLEGGTSITLRADMSGIKEDQRANALESVKTVIQRRIDLFGVSEPIIQSAHVNNDYRVIVDLPGVTDVSKAVNLIGNTAQLTFWEDKGGTPSATPDSFPQGMTSIFTNPQKTNLTGSDLESATVGFDSNTSSPEVNLVFTTNGAGKFAEITARNTGKRLAIALDNQLIEAPTVNQAITGGNARITGFNLDQAKALSIQLNAGVLPVSLSVLEQRTIGATLGESSLHKSLIAGFLGFFIIVVFMVVLYGRLGVLASVALTLYTLFVLSIFKLSTLTPYGVTLSLAGIAGFVLSVGMAVDANILIFERMKEELRRGKPREVVIELGFSRAWSSVRDSNISSIITSLILIEFGSGIVRGFAVTLLIGVLVSMFSAIVVTRTFLRMVYK